MKKNRQLVTGLLFVMTVVLLGTTFYISTLLSSPNKSPTQIQKTKAAAITYSKNVNLADNFGADTITPGVTPGVTAVPTLAVKAPTAYPTLLALAPTLLPTAIPTKAPTKAPTAAFTILASAPTDIPKPTNPFATPTLQPLLAYKSTTISPTPIKDTGGMVNATITITKTPSSLKNIQPTGVQNLPETGWIQTSSILFIVATTTILFSLLF